MKYLLRTTLFLMAVLIYFSCAMGKSTVPFPSKEHPNITEWPDELFGYFRTVDLQMMDMKESLSALSEASVTKEELMQEEEDKIVKELIFVEKINDDLISISEVKAIHESKIPYQDEAKEKKFEFFSPKHLLIDDSWYGDGEIFTFKKKNEYYLFNEKHIMLLDCKKAIAYGIDLDFMSFSGDDHIDADTTSFLLKKKDDTYYLNFEENSNLYLSFFIDQLEEGYIISSLDRDAIIAKYDDGEEEVEEDVDIDNMSTDELVDYYNQDVVKDVFEPVSQSEIDDVLIKKMLRKDHIIILPFSL